MKKQFYVSSLTFISSVACNLNCSFCYLNKNNSYKDYNKLVSAAWNDGSYLNNVLQTLNKLEVNNNDIETIQLWGGETLLQVDDVTKNIPIIYENFPNINEWMISTNWLVNIDKVFKFFQEIDNYSNHFTTVTLQLSIDGPPGPITDQGHHGDWKIYRQNLIKFTNLINNYKFKQMKINMHINATLNRDLYFEYFLSYEKMKDYIEYMANFMTDIKNMCISESLEFVQEIIYPGYATPYEDTAEDGRKLARVFRLWDQVYLTEFKDKYPKAEYMGFHLGIGRFEENQNLFDGNMECNELMHALTINYDGSICECNGSYIDAYPNYLNELLEKNDIKYYQIAITHNKLTSYNPINSNEDEIQKHKWAIHDGGYRHTYSTYLHFMFSLADTLIDAGQILPQYKDKELLLKHCKLMLNCLSCSRNNIIDTHCPYLTPVGAMRRYLNGAMDYVYEKGLIQEKMKMKEYLRS